MSTVALWERKRRWRCRNLELYDFLGPRPPELFAQQVVELLPPEPLEKPAPPTIEQCLPPRNDESSVDSSNSIT
ncbi:hypothetical protein Q1695_016167 [Nippostrongylus brasiliensis]|nr:hypothetical protein Q1695_016167 [Nippostrongylus brasiliensis]